MAETTDVHIGENSPEQVAYKLFRDIATIEKRSLSGNSSQGWTAADRKYVLDTYAECLNTVQNPAYRVSLG